MHQAVKRLQRSRKDERLETRVTPDQKRLIESAAALRGSTVTDFGVVSAQQAAADTIRDFETLAEPITRIVLDNYSLEEYRQLYCLWSMPSVKACAPVHSFAEPTFPASKGRLVRPPR
jgi:uncharacterized protein (DUF1778 family)